MGQHDVATMVVASCQQTVYQGVAHCAAFARVSMGTAVFEVEAASTRQVSILRRRDQCASTAVLRLMRQARR